MYRRTLEFNGRKMEILCKQETWDGSIARKIKYVQWTLLSARVKVK
jgi:hypothetical protein